MDVETREFDIEFGTVWKKPVYIQLTTNQYF